jgi:cell division protein ZapA
MESALPANPEPSPELRTMNLEIYGQRFTVTSDNKEDQVSAIVRFVNDRINQIQRSSPRPQRERVALLAALNIAEELFKERRAMETVNSTVRERSQRLLRTIDSACAQLGIDDLDELGDFEPSGPSADKILPRSNGDVL